MKRVYATIGCLALFIISLDQWTKQLILDRFTYEGQTEHFLGWFNFTLVHNPGAAFGMFRNLPDPWREYFFYALPFVVLGILWFTYVRKIDPKDKWGAISMGLVVGGAFGNYIDRIRFGYVIDFIDWSFPMTGTCPPLFYHFTPERCHWPKFNVADSAICIAAGFLIIQSIFEARAEKARAKS